MLFKYSSNFSFSIKALDLDDDFDDDFDDDVGNLSASWTLQF
jgi:hypothetical protein